METMKRDFMLRPVPQNMHEAVKYLTAPTFLHSTRHKGQHWRADRNGAHPDIVAFERAFVRRMRKLNIPVFAHCVVRNNATQGRLYATGRTLAKPGESPHNHGKAVDLVHGVRAWDIPRGAWDVFGHVGKEVAHSLGVKVDWGGEWHFYDPAHWELEDWRHYPSDPQVEQATLEELLAFYEGGELRGRA
ncbi:hypothetical protein [Tortoise microvirus 39]|nr:hypothetical protein [Tortoise microvirus 39]